MAVVSKCPGLSDSCGWWMITPVTELKNQEENLLILFSLAGWSSVQESTPSQNTWRRGCVKTAEMSR